MGITSMRPFFSAAAALRSICLALLVARHRVEGVRRLDELEQPVALGLDDLLLLLLEQLRGDAHAALDGLGEHPVEVDAREPGGHLRQRPAAARRRRSASFLPSSL